MMTNKRSVEKKRFEISVEPPVAIILLKRKSVWNWMVSVARTVWTNCVDGKALTDMCITVDKEFLEVGKRRLSGDTAHEATSDEDNRLTPLWYCQINHCIF